MKASTPSLSSVIRREQQRKNLISLKPSNTFFSYNMNEISHMDIDKLRDELIKIKTEYHKKIAENKKIKIAYTKLENENNSNCKIIKELIAEANREMILKEEGVADLKQTDEKTLPKIGQHISKDSLNKSSEHYLTHQLKMEVIKLRNQLEEKETVIASLKNKQKATKYSELDCKYAKTFQELMNVTEKFQKARRIFENDHNDLRAQTTRLLMEVDEYRRENDRNSVKLSQAQYELDNPTRKALQSEVEQLRIKNSQSQSTINEYIRKNKEKENENKTLRRENETLRERCDELKSIESKREEAKKESERLRNKNILLKDKVEKLEGSISSYQEENEKLKKKKKPNVNYPLIENERKKLERDNRDLQDKIKEMEEKNQKLNLEKELHSTNKQTAEKENDDLKSQIEDLKKESDQLKKENEELKKENQNLLKQLEDLKAEIEREKEKEKEREKEKEKEKNNEDNFFVTGEVQGERKGYYRGRYNQRRQRQWYNRRYKF